jgi:carbonic anhydrase
MKRRKLGVIILGSAVAALAVAASAVGATGWNHDPASAMGPKHWGTLDPTFKTCGTGRSQSPVNIATARTVSGKHSALRFRYPDNELVVENTGHVIEVPLPADNHDTLRIGHSVYHLVQFHFHAPSEHTLNGRHYDLEVHLVHENAAGQTAVVAVFMNIGRHPNKLVNKVFRNAPVGADEETDVGVESSAKELLPAGSGHAGNHGKVVIRRYYSYFGSLTTPPCTEPVRWIILKDPVNVSAFAVGRMHKLVSLFPGYGGYPNNNRPAQPLNGREIVGHS